MRLRSVLGSLRYGIMNFGKAFYTCKYSFFNALKQKKCFFSPKKCVILFPDFYPSIAKKRNKTIAQKNTSKSSKALKTMCFQGFSFPLFNDVIQTKKLHPFGWSFVTRSARILPFGFRRSVRMCFLQFFLQFPTVQFSVLCTINDSPCGSSHLHFLLTGISTLEPSWSFVHSCFP